jgi:hypothetical protein
MTYSQSFPRPISSSFNGSLQSALPTSIDKIQEIEIKVYNFNLFDNKVYLITQSNHHNLLIDFFNKLNEGIDYDVAKKELVLAYFAQEHPDSTPEKAWKMYQMIPGVFRINFLEAEEKIKSTVLQNKRDKKIDALFNDTY